MLSWFSLDSLIGAHTVELLMSPSKVLASLTTCPRLHDQVVR
ncbi:hypothetical protein LINGRAHAP2_LOCUS12411 [Linum grandiflorum]